MNRFKQAIVLAAALALAGCASTHVVISGADAEKVDKRLGLAQDELRQQVYDLRLVGWNLKKTDRIMAGLTRSRECFSKAEPAEGWPGMLSLTSSKAITCYRELRASSVHLRTLASFSHRQYSLEQWQEMGRLDTTMQFLDRSSEQLWSQDGYDIGLDAKEAVRTTRMITERVFKVRGL